MRPKYQVNQGPDINNHCTFHSEFYCLYCYPPDIQHSLTQLGVHHSLFVGQDCVLHFLIPKNTGSGEPKIKEIGEKFQDNNEFILHKYLRNTRGNQVIDMI